MNRRQRDKNRATARRLNWESATCPECGERGKHWVQATLLLRDFLNGVKPKGFWVCPKFYGPDGRRIDA